MRLIEDGPYQMLAELEGVGDDLRLARDGKRHTLDHLAHAGKESMVDEVGRRFHADAAHLAGTLDPKRNRHLPFELRITPGIIDTTQDIALTRTEHRVEVLLGQLTIGQVRFFHIDHFGGVQLVSHRLLAAVFGTEYNRWWRWGFNRGRL